MLGLIFDIRSFAVHDGPGIRQTIFLKGCPMRCIWCHNPESQEHACETIQKPIKIGRNVMIREETVGRWMSVEEVIETITKDIPFLEESGGGITLSGGEPLMQPGFAAKLLKAIKQLGLKTAIDTCGYVPWQAFQEVLPFTNLFLYDLKLADPKAHIRYTGVSNELIINNLMMLSKTGKEITIRIPLIPDLTDNQENLRGLREVISCLPNINRIDLLPYHPSAHNKYMHLCKTNPFPNIKEYDSLLAQQIKVFFQDLAPIVSIGG